MAATSHEEHDNAISKDYPMFSRPVTSTDFLAALTGDGIWRTARAGTDREHLNRRPGRRDWSAGACGGRPRRRRLSVAGRTVGPSLTTGPCPPRHSHHETPEQNRGHP